MDFETIARIHAELKAEIAKVIVGNEELIDGVLVALFAEGSVLVEGPPGLGKTLLVRTLSRTLACRFSRIQFTPDLMPADLTGHAVYDMNARSFHFHPGPVFTNLLLADEINRAPAKTQSALLEAMEERQVTVDGKQHALEAPFLVLATQNPLEMEGTYPLPEAQIDRFMFKLNVDYPSGEEQEDLLRRIAEGRSSRNLDTFGIRSVTDAATVVSIGAALGRVLVEEPILRYISDIVSRTRVSSLVAVGASPRAAVQLLLASRSLAACRGRDYVIPDDVKETAPWTLRHRLRLHPEAEIEGHHVDAVLGNLLEQVPAPSR